MKKRNQLADHPNGRIESVIDIGVSLGSGPIFNALIGWPSD